MRAILLVIFLVIVDCSFAQVKKLRFDYSNGHIYASGKILACPGYDEKYPHDDSKFRKIGKWLYFYQNGSIKKVERYRKIDDCSLKEIPDGIWQYFNEQAVLIKQDEYKNGILWTSDIARYYKNDQLAGVFQIREGVPDTLIYEEPDTSNFIQNGDFNFYFGEPQQLVNEGRNEIGKQIPFWYSQDKNTPDYYNQYRSLKNVPDNLLHTFNEKYNYVGIILYHQPTAYYSEYLTGTIFPDPEAGKKYCLKIRIRLSENSGFSINQLGLCFSQSIQDPEKQIPQLLFDPISVPRDRWVSLCSFYTATGNEKYITIGRFSSLDKVKITPLVPLNASEGEYNQSAYYLLDEVKLMRDTSECSCKIRDAEWGFANRLNFDLMGPPDSLIWDKTFVLNKIFFEFDKAELIPASLKELNRLLEFLKTNNAGILLAGHTDNSGSYEHNKSLSLSRAGSVSEWLIENGIDRSRIRIEGFGPDFPLVDNDTEENRAINRRVEFKLMR
jgi:OmpA-OmpF porin, OOP family